jgi:hypothetical protein
LTPRRQCRDQADHLGMRGRGRIAQLRYAVSFGQPIQFDERANALATGELQLRRAPRKEDLEQLAMTEQRVKFSYCGVK